MKKEPKLLVPPTRTIGQPSPESPARLRKRRGSISKTFSTNYTPQVVLNSHEEEPPAPVPTQTYRAPPPSISQRFLRWLAEDYIGFRLDWAQMVLSVVYAATYIAATYDIESYHIWDIVVEVITLICIFFFLVDSIRGFLHAPTIRAYILSPLFWADVATVVPVATHLAFTGSPVYWQAIDTQLVHNPVDTLTLLFRLTLPIRFYRMYLRADIVIRRQDTEVTVVNRVVLRTLNLIISMVLTGAGYLQIVLIQEIPYEQLLANGFAPNFPNMVFYIVLITLTIDYPNAGNSTEHVVVLVFIVILFVIAAPQLANLIDLLDEQSRYSAAYSPTRGYAHVVLAGDVNNPDFLTEFLTEFYHEDHGQLKIQVVVLSPIEPSDELVELLEDPRYANKIAYVKGTVLNEPDLVRAKVETAKAVFILSSTSSLSYKTGMGDIAKNTADAANVMRALKLNSFNRSKGQRAQHLIMQIIRQDNKVFALEAGADQVMCIDQMRMNLLARDCICPGFSTLIANISRSSAGAVHVEENYAKGSFLDEYTRGISFELYSVKCPERLRHRNFARVVEIVYERFDAVIMGVVVPLGVDKNHYALNPGRDYMMKGTETFFLLAESSEIAKMIGDNNNYEGLPAPRGQLEYRWSVEMKEMSPVKGPTFPNHSTPPKLTHLDSSRALMENFPFTKQAMQTMERHILVLSTRPLDSGFFHFVEPLRSKSHGKHHKPIVVLCPAALSKTLYNSIFTQFHDLHYIQGSPMDVEDLAEARLRQASRVVILAASSKDAVKSEEEDDTVTDAESIFIYLTVLRMQKVHDESDIQNPEVMTLDPESCEVDRVVSERYFNVLELNYVSSILLLPPFEQQENPFFNSLYAAGTVWTESLLDLIICQSYHNPHCLPILDELMSPREEDCNVSFIFNGSKIPQSQIFPVDVPKDYANKTWRELFLFLLRVNDTVALGLYRSQPEAGEDRLFPQPYVFTCPGPDVIVHDTDRIFGLMRP